MDPHSRPSSETSRFRVAVIGCGGRGREHIPGLLADSRLEIVALADVKQESADLLNHDFNLGATVYSDFQTMLCAENPDIAVIALWTNLHYAALQACVSAGVKVVMCEKPMAPTWEECQAIARLAEESGTILTFCHQRRFASGNLAVRAMLDQGWFGEIERMELFSPSHLLDCGTHSVDQAMAFNHELPVKWVHGAVDLSSQVNFFGIPAEGMSTGIFVFENGVHVTIRTGRLEMDLWGGVRVTGSEGFVEVFWDGQVRRAVVYRDPTWCFPPIEETEGEQMIGVVRNAVDCLISGKDPELSYKKALRTSEVLFALYESARTHQHIELPIRNPIGNPLFAMLESKAKTHPS